MKKRYRSSWDPIPNVERCNNRALLYVYVCTPVVITCGSGGGGTRNNSSVSVDSATKNPVRIEVG